MSKLMGMEGSRSRFIEQLLIWGSFVRFSHSIFALPFALAMLVYLTREHSIELQQIVSILVSVVAARTAAMSFNRIIDAEIDRKNPRTSARELPAGKVTFRSALSLLFVSSLVFIASAWMLGDHCFVLSPLVLLLLFGYSLTKRFTSLAHFVLGVALACAPGGVWYAITATFAWLPIWMMGGVLFWVAGFDILYALQDESFDRRSGLHSIPAWLGANRALLVSRISHLLAVLFFVIFGFAAQLSWAYGIGVIIFAWMLFSQQQRISNASIETINVTFFNRNAWGSVIYLVAMSIDIYGRTFWG